MRKIIEIAPRTRPPPIQTKHLFECISEDLKDILMKFGVATFTNNRKITCPGVWLCTHGYLEATIKTLGYYFRTGAMEPRFPLLSHDQFTMEGYFKAIGSMDELERVLAAEQVEITLWQNGRRLAYFLGKLSDVMQTGLPKLTCPHNTNVQLLMKATPAFPGIIAPKVELSAQVGVQDRLSRRAGGSDTSASLSHYSKLHAENFVAPTLDTERKFNRHCQMSSQDGSCFSYLEEPRRQRPVCHTKTRSTNGASKYTSATACPNTALELDTIGYKNGERRLSACSSHMSSNSYSLSQIMRNNNYSGSSSCSHSPSDGSNSSFSTPDEHQRRCHICQSYRKVFS